MINKFGNMSSESIQYLFSSEDNDNFKKSLSNYDKASDKRSFKIKNRKTIVMYTINLKSYTLFGTSIYHPPCLYPIFIPNRRIVGDGVWLFPRRVVPVLDFWRDLYKRRRTTNDYADAQTRGNGTSLENIRAESVIYRSSYILALTPWSHEKGFTRWIR